MEDEDVEPQDTPVPTSVPSPDYSPPHEQPQQSNQMTIGPDRGLLVEGSQSLVRVKLPGCFTPSRVFFLEEMEFNRDWLTEAISEPESMELAAIWLILQLRANQTVDPGLALPAWYPTQLLGYSTQTLTYRFDFLRQQAQREPPSMDQTFRMLECFVKAGQVRSHLTLKRTTKRKLAREASRKGMPAKQPRAGGAESSQSQQRGLRTAWTHSFSRSL